MSDFTSIPRGAWVAENHHAFAFRDAHPVTPGHTLVVSKRVFAPWFEATADERRDIFALVEEVRTKLDRLEPKPDGYNIGINVGEAAGQTIPHLHVHVIPRYRGDMDDPRGGVRHVIPSKGNYKRKPIEPLVAGEQDHFARHLSPLFDRATEIAIVAAFVKESGLHRIGPHLHDAVARGAHVRILTGDYLAITQASALRMLLNWQKASGAIDGGRLEARVIVAADLRTSFHPKSYRFAGPDFAVAFVGSSNLSRVALEEAVEWNLRVDRDHDRVAYDRIVGAFEQLWAKGRELNAEWIDNYVESAAKRSLPLPLQEVDDEPPEAPQQPHAVQVEALKALRESRAAGRRRAIVVLATGLGKTALAAFDHQQLREELGGARPRLLFLAHRVELLRQAADTYTRVLRQHGDQSARIHLCVGDQGTLDGDLVFASVAKLARADQLEKLAEEEFDYVVVDEVHHAAAGSYRKILNVLEPRFILGLTATPDRADAADILGIFDDHIAYRADIARGVEIQRLVPFHYFGVKDDIDYEQIPWRNKKFVAEELTKAAETEARMETMWRAWREHPGARTLIFCCSITHAVFVRDWLRTRNVAVAAVFSGPGSDDRDGAIEALRAGTLDAVCSVDVFNEGVDVPQVDRVVMLRPTESSVVFLQQLGRGLRAFEGKSSVTVIDFVGNHRVFLERVRTLLSLAGGRGGSREFLEGDGRAELPAGCSVELELEAKELLASLFKSGSADEVERLYTELRDERGERPTAGELQRMGYPPRPVSDRHGGWFGFVRRMGDLAAEQEPVVESLQPFLHEVETTDMRRSFKMITLEALIDANALATGLPLRDVAARSHAVLRRSPELFDDIVAAERVDTLTPDNARAWQAYWRKNPIEAWTGAKKTGRTWFRVEDDRLVPAFAIAPEHLPALSAMVHELVDYRLAAYRIGKRLGAASAEGFVCKVFRNDKDPILKLPDRDKVAGLPDGDIDVRLNDGSVWLFRFAKIACNVARPVGSSENRLPNLLRQWFGPRAGQSGTNFQVRFFASPDGLWVEPLGEIIQLRNKIVAYPDLRAAAGHASDGAAPPDSGERIALPFDREDPDLFAVRVSGSSMDGGDAPMRDGDWAVLRLAREPQHNRAMLIQVASDGGDFAYVLKRLKNVDRNWVLTSDNPDGPTIAGTAEMVPIARVERVVPPERLAPPVGTKLTEDALAAAFGIDVTARSGRHDGHLLIVIDRDGMLEEFDRVRYAIDRRRPGETAYVLAARDGGYRYCGVGRFSDDDGLWHIPSVDHETWRKWGGGREVSKRLPEGAAARAQAAVDAILALPDDQRLLTQAGGARARVVRAADRGGLRIEVSSGNERTISLTDIAWVAVADDDVRENGGVLDEDRVNRARYLEGTPKGSTRWIDTQWAVAAWLRVRDFVGANHERGAGADRRVRRDDGTLLAASFSVEVADGKPSIVYASGGGTRSDTGATNPNYREGLELVIARLRDAGLVIVDALLETDTVRSLSEEQRRLRPKGFPYPIAVGDDARAVRAALTAAAAQTGRRPGAKGAGNPEKRLRIIVARPDGSSVETRQLAAFLEGVR